MGTKIIKDIPDVITSKFQTFQTKDESKKKVFIDWIEKILSENQVSLNKEAEYERYVRKRRIEAITSCPNCKYKFETKSQRVCEQCGTKRETGLS